MYKEFFYHATLPKNVVLADKFDYL